MNANKNKAKPDTAVYSLKETHFNFNDTHRLTEKVWKKYSMQMEIKA